MNPTMAQVVAPMMIIGVALVVAAPLAGFASSPLGPSGTATATTGVMVEGTELLLWQTYFNFANLMPYIAVGVAIEILAVVAWKHFKHPDWKSAVKQRVRGMATPKVIVTSIASLLAVVSIAAVLAGIWSTSGLVTFVGILPYIGIGAATVLSAINGKRLLLTLSKHAVQKRIEPERKIFNKQGNKLGIEDAVSILKSYKHVSYGLR